MHIGKRQALVRLDEALGFLGVALGAADSRHDAAES
jgi:hypothetical protein